jgi:hypothetical protein
MRVRIERNFYDTQREIELIADDADSENWCWQQLAKYVFDSPIDLTQWELNFLNTIPRQRSHLSERQRHIIYQLCRQAGFLHSQDL